MIKVQSYYQILNVPPDASAADLKSAFRRLALVYHPDKNKNSPEAEARFKMINTAYIILSDETSRQSYDSYLKTSTNAHKYQSTATSTSAGPTDKPALPLFSVQAFSTQMNVLLWDIEDFLRETPAPVLQWQFSGKFLWFYLVKVLDFMDKWICGPADYEEYLANRFSRSKLQLENYFYHLRIKLDKFFRELTLDELLKPVPGYDLSRIDCILEAEKHAMHYLGHLQLAARRQINTIPPYRFSALVFADRKH